MKKPRSRLAIARHAYGLSQPELAVLAGVNVSTLRDLEQETTNPHYHLTGGWKEACTLLAAALAVSCDELWPMTGDELRLLAVSGEDRAAIAPPDRELHRSDLRSHVEKTLEGLSDQERRVLDLRLGFSGPEKDLTETATELSRGRSAKRSISRERVRQLEHRAYRKLRTSRSTPQT